MTTETLIEKVRAKLGRLDAQGEQLLATALEIIQDVNATPSTQPAQENFASHNITLEEYRALPREAKWRYQDQAAKMNRRWIENQLNRLKAKWIMVVNGQVVLHGATLDSYPEDEDFLALCQKSGKYPFVFFSPRVFAIEEHPTLWHSTNEPADAYPALSITIAGNNNRFATEADLDTGAVDCYAALELLQTHGVIKTGTDDVLEISEHLSQSFIYSTKRVWLELVDEAGVSRQGRATIICVDDWHNSPFTAINPKRSFLLGRNVLFNLRPRITLDFDARITEVRFGKIVI
jgi:hypothetical protein